MMKSWADHCSSDEDEDYSVVDDESEEKEETQLDDDNEVPNSCATPEEGVATGAANAYEQHGPPFTAFIGNLSYDIEEPSQLQQALSDVVFSRLGERINTLGGRISYYRDGNTKQHRGFGYVELATLEEVRRYAGKS